MVGGRDRSLEAVVVDERVDQLAGPIGAEVAVHHDVAVAQPAIDAGDDGGLHEFIVLVPRVGRRDRLAAPKPPGAPIPWTIAS